MVDFKGDFLFGGATAKINAAYMHSFGDVVVGAMASEVNINIRSAATHLVGLDLPNTLHKLYSMQIFAISGTASAGEKKS